MKMSEVKKTRNMLELEQRLGEDLGVYLSREYEEKRKSPERIGEDIGAGTNSVIKWIKKYNITTRNILESKLPLGFIEPTREEIYHKYCIERKSAIKIGEELGVTSTWVYSRLKKYKIKRRDSTMSHLSLEVKIPTRGRLYALYWEDFKDTYQIAEELGVSSSTVSRWLKKNKIVIRDNSAAQLRTDYSPPSKKYLNDLYWNQKKTLKEIGKILGIGINAVITLFDKNKIPIRTTSESMLIKGDVKKPKKEELFYLYWTERKSAIKIAAEIGVTPATVRKWLDENKIQKRNLSQSKLPSEVIKPTRDALYQAYYVDGKSAKMIAKEIGVNNSTVIYWLNKYSIPLKNSKRISSSKQFMEFIKGDATARNLVAVAARLNGRAGDAEKIINEMYEGKFKDREALHDYIQESRAEIDSLVREGVTNLGPYLGDFTLHDRDIFPVLMGEIIANVCEGTITSLEDRFMRLLRYDYGVRFNADSEKTLAEIREKKEVMQGNRKNLYQRLEEHYQGVLKLKEELK
jgi:transposase